jgi:DNA-binding GntR family transcriptional regulator
MVARKERMVESLDEHAAIVDAIRRRDQECARTLATDHLRVTTALMNKLFAQLNLKGPTGEDGAGGEQ